LYSTVLRDLPGIAGTARRYIEVTLIVAILVAFLLLRLGKIGANHLGYLMLFERTVVASLVVFVLLVSAFLLYYPIPLGRNVIAYSMGYAVYFLTRAMGLLTIDLGHYWIRQVSSVVMAVSVACLILWIMTLSRAGEAERVVVGHQWNPADQQKLKAQLDAINASLLRASGK